MSTDVHDRLAELAVGVPVAAPPQDLWRRGVRRRRRRLAAGVAGAVLAVAIGGGLGVWVGDTTAPVRSLPAATDVAAIPERIVRPDERTPGTDAHGPVGPLAAVLGAERRTGLRGDLSDALVGVSARTGEYRFLDLPDGPSLSGCASRNPSCALSPDGRTLAYWTLGGDAIDGIAALDTRTGTVEQHRLPSGVDNVVQLLWTSPETVLLAYGGRTAAARPLIWTPGRDRPHVVTGLDPRDVFSPSPRGFDTFDGTLLRDRRPTGAVLGTYRVRGLTASQRELVRDAVVAPDGRHVAVTVLGAADDGTGTLYLGRVAGRGRSAEVRLLPAPHPLHSQRVLGWRDADHVVVDGDAAGSTGAFGVEVASGRVHRLVTVEPLPFDVPVYASALWGRPTVARPAPPSVTDPRWYAGGGGALAVAAVGGALLWWGRRRRARA